MADLRLFANTSNLVRFVLKHSTTGQGLTGLTSASSGLIISTIADNEATATAYTVAGSTIETISTLGTFAAPTATKCRFKEVDSTNHKGLYEFQFADARFAVASSRRLVISVTGATNLLDTDYEIQLVQFNPYDAVRLGLTALPNAAAEAAGGLYTRGTGAGQINQAANGMVDTNPVRLNNVSQSLLDLKDFADDGYDPATHKIQGVVLTDTLTTYTGNTLQTGDSFARLGAPAGASVSADIAAIEAQTDDIGVAGAGLTNVPWNALWDTEVESEVTDALNAYDPPTRAELTSDTNSILSSLTTVSGYIDTEIATLITNVATILAAVDTEVGAIKAKTDNLPADPADASDIAASFGSIASTLATIAGYIDTEVASIVASIAALNNLSAADVNAEIVDALNVDTYAEPGQEVPPATTTLAKKLGYLYKAQRNRKTQTATTLSLYADNGTTVDQKATISDDGTTYDHSELGTGP